MALTARFEVEVEAMPEDVGPDLIDQALERSTIAQTLKAARASLAQPSRPFTPIDRSLFQQQDGSISRPTSSYSIDQLSFVRDTYGGRSDSARSNLSLSLARPETIAEEEDEGYRRESGADVLRLGGGEGAGEGAGEGEGYRCQGSESGDAVASSGSEGHSPRTPLPPAPAQLARPPKPPGAGHPQAATAAAVHAPGGYPASVPVPASGSAQQRPPAARQMSPRRKLSLSPLRRHEENVRATGSSSPPGSPGRDGGSFCDEATAKLYRLAMSREVRQRDPELIVQMCERVWDLAVDTRAGGGHEVARCAPRLLREVMGLMDLKHMKDARCLLKLSRCALLLLQMESATRGVHASGVQAAYLNIAQTLFKYSQNEGNDSVFLTERLIEPLLELLQSEAQESASNNLRVYVVGVLKNVSHDESNQKVLVQCGAVATLFDLMGRGEQQPTGCCREAHLLVQITATLRNLASQQYRHFLLEGRLDALVQVMELFPQHGELLTNVSRILSKLTLHSSACEAFARAEARVRQVARTLGASADSAPLVLRLSFVLGSLTEKSDRLRVMFAFDCEGTSLVPQLLRRYCEKSRKLSSADAECHQTSGTGLHEIDEVLVKLVRLLANIAINASVGATLASSSAVVSPLLDLLGAKQMVDSEELVLNVVAAVTNFLFYDTPSNLFFLDSNKPLLCKLLQPLLHAAYNVEALTETTRALGNLSRHADARQYMVDMRLDEALSVLLDHEDRDLVFYVCGVLVNLAAEPGYTSRLVDCCLVVPKLCTVLNDAPLDDPALRLVAVKVLTNLSLNPSIGWAVPDMEAVRCSLGSIVVDGGCTTGDSAKGGFRAAGGANERRQVVELAQSLVERLPSSGLQMGEWANFPGNDDERVV